MKDQTLIAHDLTIARGDLELCSHVNFTLSSGQILHLYGQNGIGKTTLLMMLSGLIPVTPSSESFLKWGEVLPSDWSVLYLGHLAGLSAGLSVRENLRFLHALNSPSQHDLDHALNQVGLSGYDNIPVSKLSSGQKRRATLARLWLSDDVNQLWLLDEPWTALDTAMSKRLNERLIAFTAQGGRIILTNHQPMSIATNRLNLKEFARQHDEIDPMSAY